MGHLLGHGVRFGVANDVMAAGEGIETMLSLRSVLPTMPMVAALSANHLAAILFPATLRRLYVARDHDPAGDTAMATLTERARDGRNRGAQPVADARRLQRRSAAPRHRRSSCGLAGSARPGRRGPIHGADGGGRNVWMRRRSLSASSIMSDRVGRPLSVRDGAHGLRRGRSDGKRAGSATAVGGYFPPPDRYATRESRSPGFASRDKIAAARRPPLRFGRCRCARRCRPGPPAVGDRHEGRDGRGQSDRGHHHDDRSRHLRLRAPTRLISDRSRPHRAPALRPPSLPGRARPEAAARGQCHRRRRRRHLRRAGRDAA